MSESLRGEIMDILRRTSLGTEVVADNGAVQFGHMPHIARQYWLHTVYGPVPSDVLTAVEGEIGGVVEPYRSFLLESNGLRAFRSLALYGCNFLASRDAARPQAWDLRHLHLIRPRRDLFPIGGWDADGSVVSLEVATGQVARHDAESTEIAERWPDFQSFVRLELERLEAAFDPDRVTIGSSLPPPSSLP